MIAVLLSSSKLLDVLIKGLKTFGPHPFLKGSLLATFVLLWTFTKPKPTSIQRTNTKPRRRRITGNLQERNALLGTYTDPRPTRCRDNSTRPRRYMGQTYFSRPRRTGIVCKTETETETYWDRIKTETKTYWDRMRNRSRDVLGSYAKPRPRRTGIV